MSALTTVITVFVLPLALFAQIMLGIFAYTLVGGPATFEYYKRQSNGWGMVMLLLWPIGVVAWAIWANLRTKEKK